MLSMIVRRVLIGGLPVILLAALIPAGAQIALADPFGETCTWEKEGPTIGYAQGQGYSKAACEARAEDGREQNPGYTVVFLESEPTDPWALPTGACRCGKKMIRIVYVPVMGFCWELAPDSCSGPAKGCKWTASLEWYLDVDTAPACREMTVHYPANVTPQNLFEALRQRSRDAYYGVDGEPEASKTPCGECVCGEDRVRWFFDWAPGTGYRCGAWKFRCRPQLLIVKPDIGKFRKEFVPVPLPDLDSE